jgi:hypothetical protein
MTVTGVSDLCRTPQERLLATGIMAIDDPFPPATIASWNAALDPLFDDSHQAHRAYIGADDLLRAGILTEIFTPGLFDLIGGLIPDAIVYHCHTYEIAARQVKSHINAKRLDGWHRDAETVRAYDPNVLTHLSLFVYLTDVNDEGGAFEFLPRHPRPPIRAGDECIRVTGPAGTAFVWNRSFYHRASPNRSSTRRRLLKLSIQPARLPNPRIGLPEFQAVRAAIAGTDPNLAAFFGAPNQSTELPTRELKTNAVVRISRRDQLLHYLIRR